MSSWTYTWDRENRLTNASAGSASVDYVYDALGRRVKRIDGSHTTEFTHDGEDVIIDDSTVSGVTRYQNGLGIDDKLSVKTGASTSYLLADHLGSTDALTDGTGAVTASQIYDSFGNGSNGAFPLRYQFTGREYDQTIGLQFSRARFYDHKLGRFISEDPIGFSGGDVNLYGYVSNNPIYFVDPSGLQAGSGIEFLPGGYYGKDWYETIEADFNDMKNSCECRKSFEGFGIDLDALSRSGILIGDGYALANSGLPSSAFRLSDDERAEIASRRGRASATTIGPGISTYDARPHIFFNESASRDRWGFPSGAALRRSFAHELLHAGDVPGISPGFPFSLFQDDLSYKDGWWDRPYTRLLYNCGSR